jgi:hypothetical protein
MPHLPGETLQEILSYHMPALLDTDSNALQACALACRALAAIAQPLFFQLVSLDHPTRIPTLLDLITTKQDIASWIRTLVLQPYKFQGMSTYLQLIASPEARALFIQLRAVQKLRLECVYFQLPELDIVMGNLKLLSGVSELVLNNIWVGSPAQTLGLIAQYSALSSLQIYSPQFIASSYEHGSVPADAFRHVKRLSIGGMMAGWEDTLTFFQLLECMVPHLARLVDLDLRMVHTLFACQKIINMIAPSGIAFRIGRDDGDDTLNLREASKLERLTVDIGPNRIPSFCRSLATINRPEQLCSLELSFSWDIYHDDVYHDREKSDKHWQELDAVLRCLTRTKEHHVALRLYAPPDHREPSPGISRSADFDFAKALPLTFQCSCFDISCISTD